MLDREITHAELIRHAHDLIACVEAGSPIIVAHIDRLCAFAVPLCGESILSAHRHGHYIGMMVKACPPLREERYVDTLDFAGILLLCLSGGIINNEPTTQRGKRYSYLRYAHPRDISEDMRIRLNRIIANAPEDQAVGFAKRSAFRSYCRSNLKLRAPIAGMKDPKLSRVEAVKLARSLFETSTLSDLTHLNAAEYEALLTNMFAAADRYHGEVT